MKTQRKIKLTLEQAREMYGKNESLDKLLLANFPELGVKKVGKWEDLERISGWFAGSDSRISKWNSTPQNSVRNIFATESQAQSALAMAQLSQLMKHVNGDWVADWKTNVAKHVIRRMYDNIDGDIGINLHYFLAFPSEEIRDQFLSDHEQLIKTYFEL